VAESRELEMAGWAFKVDEEKIQMTIQDPECIRLGGNCDDD